MKLSNRTVVALVVAVLFAPACKDDPLVETTRHEIADAGGFDAAGVEVCGTPGAGNKSERNPGNFA